MVRRRNLPRWCRPRSYRNRYRAWKKPPPIETIFSRLSLLKNQLFFVNHVKHPKNHVRIIFFIQKKPKMYKLGTHMNRLLWLLNVRKKSSSSSPRFIFANIDRQKIYHRFAFYAVSSTKKNIPLFQLASSFCDYTVGPCRRTDLTRTVNLSIKFLLHFSRKIRRLSS